MNRYWPVGLGLFLGLSALVLGIVSGSNLDEGWQFAARWTARISFPLFMLTFVASSLAILYPSKTTKKLLRNRRYWGLRFAACFVIHLVALLVFNWRIGEFPPAGLLDPGVIAYTILLAMVLTSNAKAQKSMGRAWTWLHRTGMWGFLVIFGRPGDDAIAITYMVIALSGAGLRIAAWLKRRNQSQKTKQTP